MSEIFKKWSPRERRIIQRFLVAGAITGVFMFTFGRGGIELVRAPRYQPTLPLAGDVDLDRARARRAFVNGVHADITPPDKRIETADAGNWIRIPSLSINVPLAAAHSLKNEDILRALQIGVVRYPNGVEPGQPGVVAVAGHSTGEPWKGRYRFAFLNARKLHEGDVVHIDHQGTRYTYRVTSQRLLNPRSTPTLQTAAATPRLALISCWPLWTTNLRLVIDGELAGRASLVIRPHT